MITESNSLAESESWNVVPRRASRARAPDIACDLEERARELLTMAAHDLRSPLAVIRLRAHPIMQRWRSGQDPTPAEWALVLDRVCGVAEDALNMIDDVLAIERVDQSGSPALAPRETDVEVIIKKAIAREKDALEQARCPVTIVRRKGLACARGPWDHVYLLRLFGNLLRNVATHAQGAPVQIILSRRGSRLGMVFADHGPGLQHRRREQLESNPVDGTETERAVHGVGLWIVRRSVERLGGRLSVRSRSGYGLAFDVELPGLET